MMHDNLTIVSVYGHTNGASAIPSLVKSLQELPGSRGLLLSPQRPDNLPNHIEHRKIFPLDYRQYSWFMMYSLHEFIDTTHALVVQDDGWVLNGNNLTKEHYQYDYIGALANAALDGDNYYYNWSWREIQGPKLVVQNGGFSLRSLKFLQAMCKHGIIHHNYPAIPFCNEDVQLTTFLRPAFESVGIKYAPDEVAKQFSVEYLSPLVHDDIDFEKLVGFHGQSRKLLANNKIIVGISDYEIEEQHREAEFLDFLRGKGYVIDFIRLPKSAQKSAEERNQTVSG